MREVPPPLSVTRPPPSSTVSLVNVIGAVTVIVAGALPHANTMVPPAFAACWSAAAVQLAGVPSPTVAVGEDVSASAGRSHTATGGVVVASGPALPSWVDPPHEHVMRYARAQRRIEPSSHDRCG